MADAETPRLYKHPKRKPPANWVESLRKKLPEGSRRRKRFDALACPVAEPSQFRASETDLAAQLMPTMEDEAVRAARAEVILQEAQDIFQEAENRAAGATSRATTLQEAVGIAATLLLAGAGLIVGQTALHGFYWVLLFALFLLGATFSLVMSGLRALSAASTIHAWRRPAQEDIIERSQQPEAEARIALAASLLNSYGYNSKVAAWKVAYLGAAAWWFRIALAFIVSIAMLIGIYAVSNVDLHNTNKPQSAKTSHHSHKGDESALGLRPELTPSGRTDRSRSLATALGSFPIVADPATRRPLLL
jgi:hypothetical protein